MAREALAEARDNATFATPDEHVGLAEPDGASPPRSRAVARRASPTTRPRTRSLLPLELERIVRGTDPRIRQVVSTDYGDGLAEIRDRHFDRHLGVDTRADGVLPLGPTRSPAKATRRQTGGGYTVGREPTELDVAAAAATRCERATRLLGARKPAEQAARRWSSTDGSPRLCLSVLARHAFGRGGREGTVAVRRAAR